MTVTKPVGWQTLPKSYDDQGFLITAAAAAAKETPVVAGVVGAAFRALNGTAGSGGNGSTVTSSAPVPSFTGGVAGRASIAMGLGLGCYGVLLAALVL